MYGQPPVLLQIETDPQEGTVGSFKEYYELLRKKFAYFQKIVHKYRLQQLDMINKDKPMNQYKPGDLVCLSSLQTFLVKPVVESLKSFI